MAYNPLTLLYGSQTGNARAIAAQIAQLVREHLPIAANFEAQEMGKFIDTDEQLMDRLFIPNSQGRRVLVAVLSTTGSGDLPDNAMKFMRLLKRKANQYAKESKNGKNGNLALQYAVLGLGDSNYDHFNEAAKTLDKLLTKAGAIQILPLALADDGTGLEQVVEPFKKELIEKLRMVLADVNVLNGETANTATVASPSIKETTATYAQEDTQGILVNQDDQLRLLSEKHNAVIDAERKISFVVDKPPGLARLPKCALRVRFRREHSELPVSLVATKSVPSQLNSQALPSTCMYSSPYLCTRFNLSANTEAVLQGYTPEAPVYARLSACRYESQYKSSLKTASECDPIDARIVIHMEFELPSKDTKLSYNPGDSIGIYVGNSTMLVEQLCERLCIDPSLIVDFEVRQPKDPGANPAIIPSHLRSGVIRDILTYAVDLTSPPSKALFRLMAEYCDNESEKTQLYHIASREGKTAYDMFVNNRMDMLSILRRFPSCQPSLPHLLAELQPLQPRYYSITTSPLLYPNYLHICFSVVKYMTPDGIRHDGVATHHLWQLAVHSGLLSPFDGYDYEKLLSHNSSEQKTIYVPVFLRRATDFCLPNDLSLPIIMIGPGTGIAPFRSFVQHRSVQRAALATGGAGMGWWRGLDVEEKDESKCYGNDINDRWYRFNVKQQHLNVQQDIVDAVRKLSLDRRPTQIMKLKFNGLQESYSLDSFQEQKHDYMEDDSSVAYEELEWKSRSQFGNNSDSDTSALNGFGEALLFFGCRGRDVDYLYRNEWAQYVSNGTLYGMYTAFSREKAQKVYVQDILRCHGEQVADLVLKFNARVFICGDGIKMARDVIAALTDIIHQYGCMSVDDSKLCISKMMSSKQIVQDIWS